MSDLTGKKSAPTTDRDNGFLSNGGSSLQSAAPSTSLGTSLEEYSRYDGLCLAKLVRSAK